MWDWTGADPCVHCRGKGLTPDLAWNLTWSSVPRSDPRAGSVEQWPAHQSFGVCKAAIQGAAAHRRVRRRDQGRAVGDDSASRNRKFESTPLQERVACEPQDESLGRGARNGAELTAARFTRVCRVRAKYASIIAFLFKNERRRTDAAPAYRSRSGGPKPHARAAIRAPPNRGTRGALIKPGRRGGLDRAVAVSDHPDEDGRAGAKWRIIRRDAAGRRGYRRRYDNGGIGFVTARK
jgi:hypothetical protein